ncbi:hypothetical protein D5086_017484 [Populus alba]|uniref:Uncharacterized protein n=1 Tax=Populus alba TaxID=43335 RepID=A0ACC4BMH2_POPAL
MASFSLVLNGGSVVPSARLFHFSLELLIPSAPFVPNSRAACQVSFLSTPLGYSPKEIAFGKGTIAADKGCWWSRRRTGIRADGALAVLGDLSLPQDESTKSFNSPYKLLLRLEAHREVVLLLLQYHKYWMFLEGVLVPVRPYKVLPLQKL